MVRIGGAFLAGVLVALASALLYIKATSVKAPEAKIVQTAEPTTPAKPIIADATPPQPPTFSSTDKEKEKRTKLPAAARHHAPSHPQPTELAQNNPPVLSQPPARSE